MTAIRRMRRSSWAAGMVTLAFVAPMTGCGGGGGTAKQEKLVSSASWVATTPPGTGPVDTVNWDVPTGEATSLDYVHAAQITNNTVLANICEGLLRLSPDLKFEPSLAASYDNPTPTTWVYKLRSGVRFADGKPMTADDVVFSLKRNLDEKLASFWAPWYGNVTAIKATGPSEVTVTLKQPDPAFNEFLATAGGVVAEASYVKQQGARFGTPKGGVMCTGPFKLDKWIPGSKILTSRNPYYWGPRPQVAHLNFQFLTNASTLTQALKSGAIDGAYDPPVSATSSLQNTPAGKLYLGRSLAYTELAFTARPGPIQNVAVRKALTIALNRNDIARNIYKGTAVPVSTTFFPGSWGYGEKVFKAGYDAQPDLSRGNLDEAKKLVASAGKLRTLNVLTNADDVAQTQLAVYLQSVAKQIGLTVKIVELPAAQQQTASFSPAQLSHYDMNIYTQYSDIPEPLELEWISLLPDGVFNWNKYNNSKVTQWVTQARATTDPDARADLLVKAQAQAYGKDFLSTALVNTAQRLFMGRRITGAVATATSYLYYPWALKLGAAG